jgi:hypothetical protein
MVESDTAVNESELIDLTRAYVALSNAHRREFIVPMFEQNAVYFSAYVGEFRGRDSIAKMRGGFFARFPDVCWHVEDYHFLGGKTVRFNFTMTATDLQGPEPIKRSANERIKFNERGYIEFLEVNGP